ncbi:CHAT domain-containing protein [uncultured Pelagimonas sp.]|uniref:CHAT domain-containing protein n=1 Tax=uncultured Pelagimonas sp. TaxID=1618102 RepID=UPI00261817AE|nr:CHAT domain-containing protein [uncultured Pelagimonas sp.]
MPLKPLLIGACLALLHAPAQAQTTTDATQMGERAFEGAQWILATKASRAVAQMGARAAKGDGPLALLIRERQQTEADLTKARSLYAVQFSNADAKITRARLQEVEDALAELDVEIREQFPNYAEFSNPKPLSYQELREQLAPNEGLLLFLSAPFATYVWAVSNQGQSWHRADVSAAQLGDRIRYLRRDLDPTALVRAAVPLPAPSTPAKSAFDFPKAHALFSDLITPVLPVLDKVDHLYVVKDGALSGLPLAVLLTDTPSDKVTFSNAPWLVRRFALTTLPGVSSLPSIRAAAAMTADAPELSGFVGFGNPDFDGASTQSGPASRAMGAFFDGHGTLTDAVRSLAPLPGTARELRDVSGLFPPELASVFTGPKATETNVKTAPLETAKIISFATHGLITGDLTGLAEPALAFTPPQIGSEQDDGLLTASEAAELQLNADWVILSACNTAAGDGTPGAEGLSGLARAFLFAGARSILVSHWPVRDDVTATLTKETLARLQHDPDLGKSQALRLSMLDLISQPDPSGLAHPSAWAPFVVVGDGN